MQVKRSQIEKITISGIKHMDDITVIFEDYNEACGKTIIQTFDASWSYQWGGLAGRGMEEFFRTCGFEYLVNKLNPYEVNEEIDARGGVHKWIREGIIEARKEGCLTKERAKEIWDEIEWCDIGDDSGSEIIGHSGFPITEIFGDEWWYAIPKKKNPKYEYLERVVLAIREALNQ